MGAFLREHLLMVFIVVWLLCGGVSVLLTIHKEATRLKKSFAQSILDEISGLEIPALLGYALMLLFGVISLVGYFAKEKGG